MCAHLELHPTVTWLALSVRNVFLFPLTRPWSCQGQELSLILISSSPCLPPPTSGAYASTAPRAKLQWMFLTQTHSHLVVCHKMQKYSSFIYLVSLRCPNTSLLCSSNGHLFVPNKKQKYHKWRGSRFLPVICSHRINLRTKAEPCVQHQRPKTSQGKGLLSPPARIFFLSLHAIQDTQKELSWASPGSTEQGSPLQREAPYDLLWVGLAGPSFPLEGQRNSCASKQLVTHLCTKHLQSVDSIFPVPHLGKKMSATLEVH